MSLSTAMKNNPGRKRQINPKGNNRFLSSNAKQRLRKNKISKHSGNQARKKIKRSNYHQFGGIVPSKGSMWERIANKVPYRRGLK